MEEVFKHKVLQRFINSEFCLDKVFLREVKLSLLGTILLTLSSKLWRPIFLGRRKKKELAAHFSLLRSKSFNQDNNLSLWELQRKWGQCNSKVVLLKCQPQKKPHILKHSVSLSQHYFLLSIFIIVALFCYLILFFKRRNMLI